MSTIPILPDIFWDGAHIFFHHRSLTYVLHPETCAVPTPSKPTVQRLHRRSAFFGTILVPIMHSLGKQNGWGNLLSRVAPVMPVYMLTMHDEVEVAASQAKTKEKLTKVAAKFGTATCGDEGAYGE